MKKSYLSAVLFPVLILFFVPARTAPGAILAVPQRTQEKTEWCWAGVSQAIFAYYGRTFSQTQIAQYGTNGYNTWNYLYGSDSVYPYYRKGINMILSYFALLSSTYGQYVLNTTQVNTQINSGRPFIIRWGWDSGGGHFVAGRGISGNYVYIMDPLPGHGYETRTYSWVLQADGHTWTHTLQLTSYPPTPSATRAPLQLFAGDFSGNQRADLVIFRPSSGLWSVRGVTRAYFGRSGDIPVPADYDGNGKANIAIFRPSSGLWSVRGLTRFYFGRSGDVPIPMNYRSGYTTAGIFRPSSGLWSFRGGNKFYFGRSGDIPVLGPYVTRSGTWGAPYLALFRPSTGLWAIRGVSRFYWGRSGDTPVPGAYTGGENDPWRAAVFRPSTGLWAVRGVANYYYGRSGDIPVPGDYNQYWGDEAAIFRPSSGLWSIRNVGKYYYGRSGDIPATR